jgi:hypothetical protein
MTNFIQTDQSRSQCSESITVREAICTTDDDCQNRPYMSNINGRWTGRCLVPSDIYVFNGTQNITKTSPGVCEIQGNDNPIIPYILLVFFVYFPL